MKKFLMVTFAVGAWLVGALVQMPAQAQAQSVEPVPVPAKKRAVEKSADKRAARIAAEDAPVKANGGVFKCVDRDGSITYGNVGNVKGCKQIETDTVNSVPFPKPASTAARSASPGKSEGGAQRARDTDRRRILQEEMASEEKRLADLRKEFNSGEPERRGDEKNYAKYQERSDKLKADVTRSESNIESLRREIANIKD